VESGAAVTDFSTEDIVIKSVRKIPGKTRLYEARTANAAFIKIK